MKKILIVIGIILLLVVGAALVLPAIFKDDIKAAIDEEIAKSVNAEVFFDAEKFDLTLFANFPNLTISLGDFGVINREPFEGEVLMAVDLFEIVVDLNSLIFGDQPRINAILLDGLKSRVLVLEDGSANYDIAVETEDTVQAPVAKDTLASQKEAETTEFSISIDQWELINAHIIYEDRSSGLFTDIKGLNHSGSGDFSQDLFDLKTLTSMEEFTFSMGEDNYLEKKRIEVDMTLEMNLAESKYTFKENTVKINDFGLGFEGWVSLPGDDIDMDISFAAKESSFKSILSLVPGIFTEGFEDIKTEGSLEFNGLVKGKYSDATGTLPAFNINLKVMDAMFQYPDLPTPVDNIKVDLVVENKDGVIENTLVNVKDFHLDLGSNPVDGKILIKNLSNYDTKAQINAVLNLAELSQMFPMEGLAMNGAFKMNLTADGIYDSIKETIPKIKMNMSLENGRIEYAEYPIPMEDIHFTSSITNSSGKMSETTIKMDDFNMILGKEKLSAKMLVQDLNDYKWDVQINGKLDLEKITKIFPVEGMKIKGLVKADINTKGKMSDLEAERYDRLPTTGILTVTNFNLKSPDLPPKGFGIESTRLTFNPEKIRLVNFRGNLGNSDLNVTGNLTNYIEFILEKKKNLKGQLTLVSKNFNLNELMTEEEEVSKPQGGDSGAKGGGSGKKGGGSGGSGESSASQESETLEAIKVPRRINFVIQTNIEKIKYTNLNLNSFEGKVLIKNGQVIMQGVKFKTLGGNFVMNGNYDSRNIKHPKFDFDLDMKNISIPQAYKRLSTFQSMAPIAKAMQGKFSTKFNLSGELGEDMMPNYNTLSGDGLVKVVKAALTGSDVMSNISALTSLSKLDNKANKNIPVKDILMKTELKNGRVHVQPFDLVIGGYKTNISGSNGLDGSLDYKMEFEVPAGEAGKKFNQMMASISGSSPDPNTKVKLKFGVTGTSDNPKTKLLGTNLDQIAKQAAKDAVKDRLTKELGDKLGLGGDKKDQGDPQEQQKEEPKEDLKKEVDKWKKLFGDDD